MDAAQGVSHTMSLVFVALIYDCSVHNLLMTRTLDFLPCRGGSVRGVPFCGF